MRLANWLRALVALTAIVAPGRAEAQGVRLRYGVASFGEVEPLRDAATIAACGYDYIEPGLAKTLALPDPDRQEQLRRLSATGLRVETMNWFLPGADIKLTGPTADQARVNDFLERSLALAEQLGVKVIVFGSPGARSFPEGFPRERAWDQLKAFLRTAGDIIEARRYGMVIGIEPLRKPESNIVNTVAEAARLAREVNHPKVRIIVDFYHLTFENEDPDAILDAKDLIVHLQIAEPSARGFPRQEAGEARYRRFFDNLLKIGYQGRLSIEANSSDVAGDCGPALKFLKEMAAAAR
ncbi:hydroxypyruvate isomerase [Luteitalea pratensis]|uniref:Hydroxypyruvate isomerase n=1 Tax=Luteitalea pratensis TaxID=1855912 RepID=A0A143PLB1_LUTPR|nr:sugar phosphate isomerase/epimerase family protein [Luteitalea pratensis]AMY09196.1 hydroxypyruvate isomerase [Luteitalea pratensis]